MAAETAMASPINVEPLPSPASTTLPSLPTISSSNSVEPSRPQSHTSIATSQSENSRFDVELRQIPASVQSENVSANPSTANTSLEPSPPVDFSATPSPCHSNPPVSVQPESNRGSSASARQSNMLRSLSRRSSGEWLSAIIGIVSLAAMIWLGWRSYRLAVSSGINGELSACTGLIQANLTTLESSTEECKRIIAQGATYSPYQLGKRTLNASFVTGTRFIKRWQSYEGSFFYMVFIVCAAVVLGSALLVSARRRATIGEGFASPAKSDVKVTRHTKEGPKAVIGQGVRIIKHHPGQEQYPGHLRQRIRYSPEQNGENTNDIAMWGHFKSSTDTLVNPWTGSNPSRVSVTDRSVDEKHEGLIELETTGDNKSFFDPETGEFIHLTPWKSTNNNEEDSDDNHLLKAKNEGSTMRALARMATGGAAWAGGKEVDDTLITRISDADRKNMTRVPQRVGDCLAGEVTKEPLNGWPETI